MIWLGRACTDLVQELFFERDLSHVAHEQQFPDLARDFNSNGCLRSVMRVESLAHLSLGGVKVQTMLFSDLLSV
jgi:hypothetical protein